MLRKSPIYIIILFFMVSFTPYYQSNCCFADDYKGGDYDDDESPFQYIMDELHEYNQQSLTKKVHMLGDLKKIQKNNSAGEATKKTVRQEAYAVISGNSGGNIEIDLKTKYASPKTYNVFLNGQFFRAMKMTKTGKNVLEGYAGGIFDFRTPDNYRNDYDDDYDDDDGGSMPVVKVDFMSEGKVYFQCVFDVTILMYRQKRESEGKPADKLLPFKVFEATQEFSDMVNEDLARDDYDEDYEDDEDEGSNPLEGFREIGHATYDTEKGVLDGKIWGLPEGRYKIYFVDMLLNWDPLRIEYVSRGKSIIVSKKLAKANSKKKKLKRLKKFYKKSFSRKVLKKEAKLYANNAILEVSDFPGISVMPLRYGIGTKGELLPRDPLVGGLLIKEYDSDRFVAVVVSKKFMELEQEEKPDDNDNDRDFEYNKYDQNGEETEIIVYPNPLVTGYKVVISLSDLPAGKYFVEYEGEKIASFKVKAGISDETYGQIMIQLYSPSQYSNITIRSENGELVQGVTFTEVW